ncbi:polyketide synthase [Gelidibacter maritimus]|uniref:Amino acid adenylation domain-containing protein n=1 Tax=Gelidibacter maritimus TaxID=2761487 RepID=A0A7W2M2M9_9FLAO|nr:polyketide synthase [Gelidibacter maritimus]MBA6151371.1 amino acid adenylation domain-containing protein [Gelidibacter maritimus]
MHNPTSSVYQLFEKASRLYPDQLCLLTETDKLTYRETAAEISKAYDAILMHAKDENFIGVPTTRGINQVISVLAILKAGKAYLPIDFGYPKKRLDSIINNSNLSYCITTDQDTSHITALGLKPIISNDSNQAIGSKTPLENKPTGITYILYTSGSTGEPKGVCMGENAMINLINWQNKHSICKNGDRTLKFAPLSFDVSFQEIMATLSSGGTLVLINDMLRLDMVALLNYIDKQKVNRLFLPFVALQALAEAAMSTNHYPSSLKEIMTAGEQLKITPQVINLFTKLKTCILYNQYGPTECHVVSELKLDGNPADWPTLPSIGKAISNTGLYILDSEQQVLSDGNIGELCIAGECLAEGYLNKQELTDEKFVGWKSPDGKYDRIYRTGDIAKYLPDGNIEFLGRKDDQVKISGHRIELAEIESAINSLSGILQTVVIASNHLGGQSQLVAYMQSNHDNLDIVDIRKKVSEILPDYMMPSYFILVEEFPKTSSGKIDKRSLPAPEYSRPNSAPPYKAATTKIQKNLTKVWVDLLHIPEIGIDDNFFELGGTSLLAQKLVAVLLNDYDYKLPVTKLYQFPRIAEISAYLEPNKSTKTKKTYKNNTKNGISKDVAVIGMAGRFPGANSIQELWEVLKNGKETISFFSPEELDRAIPEDLRNDPLYVRARGIIPSAPEFDPAFFGLNPKVASVMDPQQRLFLEVAWEVLEQSGHLPKHYDGSVGVYAGTGMNTYYKNNILPNPELLNQVGDFQASTLNEKDYIATRTAYHLNLKGPAVSVHSACSTSLLAISQATEAIRNGQCDVAIAGGSSVTVPIRSGHLYQEGSMLSPDGHCRSFDKDGKGTVFSDGCGVVLLKSLEAAKADGDHIYGIIKGVGISNDGGGKGSFTAPSVEGQSEAIYRALQDANLAPSNISYIETHGTATPIGDPIEMEGLHDAFGEQPNKNYCAIGSIKSNMGHLTAAAGAAGFIKTILAMNHQQIPPSLGFTSPNPAIDFANSPFYVNNVLSDWDSEGIRRAGISSFGVGGTNVHVVVEEFVNKQTPSGESKPLQILTWSAKSKNSLDGYQEALGNFINASNDIKLADVAYSLSATRDSFNKRRFILATDSEDAVKQLISENGSTVKTSELKSIPQNLAFLFPGQGAQYLQMGKALYEQESVFRDAVDACAKILQEAFKYDIRNIIYPEKDSVEAEDQLKDTQYTQPALFVIEYALSQLWMNWGIKPTLLCGHSIGEFVAAHLAGIFSLKDALLLVAVRGRLVSSLPGGSMLSVRTPYESLAPMVPKTLSVAAVNSDLLCVISGEDAPIAEFAKILEAKEIPNRLLLTSHAFHSNMMDPVLEAFEAEVRKVALNIPRLPLISTVTGTWLSDSEATDPKYWTDHLRATVRFSDAMDTALDLDDLLLLEVGPGRALATLSQQKKKAKSATSIASLVAPNADQNSYHTLLSALGQLWLKGIEPDWQAFYKGQSRQRIALPAYVFDRKLCWVDPPMVPHNANMKAPTTEANNYQSEQTNNNQSIQSQYHMDTVAQPQRKTKILEKISDIIMDTSGIELEASEHDHNFLELGLDSLVLTQMAITFRNDFNTPITFRELNEELSTPNLLAEHLDQVLPKETLAPTPIISPVADFTNNNPSTFTPHSHSQAQSHLQTQNFNSNSNSTNGNPALNLIAQQLQLLGKQIELLQGNGTYAPPSPTQQQEKPMVQTDRMSGPVPANTTKSTPTEVLSEDEKKEHQKPFGASPKIEKNASDVNDSQKAFLNNLTTNYNNKTANSKAYAQKHRSHMADPRVVSGFKPLTKELVYPIVVGKSSGNKLWDIDGNEYIDALNGFGSCLFGHQPDFIKEALHNQIELGYEVGPQHPLAGEVCELLCELTHHDRSALCNTGSEAVLGAMRIARTVTGKSLIVAFSKSYHGITDEVLVRGSRIKKSFPAAPGIMPESVQNMLILDYGTEESLQIIRERAHELAAVLVEPVQSRRPEFQPVEFLREVRNITKASNTAFIFDEVITGFRMHPQGIQGMYDIKADIATYGKVIGGGLSIGAIAGSKKYMDALDGGHWQFGDDSYPEVGVTYFAGTFVRHPLALASAKASLIHLKENGPKLQDDLSRMTDRLASEMNSFFKNHELPLEINHFRSLWRLSFKEEVPYGELVFVLMRLKGVHVWDGFPCFLTTAYTEEDVTYIINAFKESIHELQKAGVFQSNSNDKTTSSTKNSKELNQPPQPGAKLGMDESGNPAWYIDDENNEGAYKKIEL